MMPTAAVAARGQVTSTGALEDQVLFMGQRCSVALRALGHEGFVSNARYIRFGRKWNFCVCGVYGLWNRAASRIRLWNGGQTRWAEDEDNDDGERMEFVPSQFCRYLLATVSLRATWFLPHACS